jgi:hypothetical protein
VKACSIFSASVMAATPAAPASRPLASTDIVGASHPARDDGARFARVVVAGTPPPRVIGIGIVLRGADRASLSPPPRRF